MENFPTWLPGFVLAAVVAVFTISRDYGWKRRQELRDELDRFAIEARGVVSPEVLELAKEASAALSLDLAESARLTAAKRARRLVARPGPRLIGYILVASLLLGTVSFILVSQWETNDAANNALNVFSLFIYAGGFVYAGAKIFPGLSRRWKENRRLRRLVERVSTASPLTHTDLIQDPADADAGAPRRKRPRHRERSRPASGWFRFGRRPGK